MFLSQAAQKLLDEGDYVSLKALPIDQLLDPSSLLALQDDCIPYHPVQDVALTGPMLVQDAVSQSTLVDPVVISSGHIFSRETINEIMRHNPGAACCPNTRMLIIPDCIIPLPQITYAIAQWKLQQAMDGVPGVDNRSLSLSMMVSTNKIRVDIDGECRPLRAFFQRVFAGKENCINGNFNAYSVPNWGFAWRSNEDRTRLEIWFPSRAISDSDVGNAIEATLKPLNLPAIEDVMAMDSTSIATMPERAYATVVPRTPITYPLAGKCYTAFLMFANQLREKYMPNVNFDDRVIPHVSVALPKTDLGVRAFGIANAFSPPSVGAANSSHSSSSRPAMNPAATPFSQSQSFGSFGRR